MNKFILSLATVATVILTGSEPVKAAPVYREYDFQQNPLNYPDEYYSNHSMGCMLLQECKENIVEITSVETLEKYYGKEFNLGSEFDQLLLIINRIGSKVYIAPEQYFPVGHRGVYHTVSNHFYLNDRYVDKEHILMSVMRHEGWHMAQDCMAGDINNNFIAVIFNEDKIPQLWKDMAKETYPKSALPWEQEAMWTGRVKDMTLEALRACNRGRMWEDSNYPPTPLTRQFLIDKGFIKE